MYRVSAYKMQSKKISNIQNLINVRQIFINDLRINKCSFVINF